MITKEELRTLGFKPCQWDKSEIEWTYDGDRIMFNFREQTLYDADEVYGKDIKLCVVRDIESLKELIYSYFKVDIENN